MEERKFVCKYCSKRFPCGKSLGGHIRTHMSDSHRANEEERSNNNNNNNAAMFNKLDASGRKRKRDLGSSGGVDDDGNGNMIYGLRENPKKTTRFVHSNNNNNAGAAAAAATTSVQMEKFCKECGKGFPSLKALCGHMACHSEKDKGRFENNNSSGLSEKNQQKLVMDSQSDTETNSVPRRSKRMRFKNLRSNNNNYNPHLPPPPSSSSLPPNGSSSVSEVEQEQEEVARCLMLLSKDSSYYYRGTTTRFALVTESSDNNSVVLEAKSPSVDTRVTVNYGSKKNSVYSNANYELVEGKKKKLTILKDEKLKKSSAEIGGYASDNSDSGYFRYGPKKVVDSDDDDDDSSDDGFFRNEIKSSKIGYLSGFEDHHHDDVESRKMLSSRGRSRNYGKDGGAMRRIDSRNKTANGFNNDGIYEHGGGGKGSWKYECLTSERDNVIGSDDSAYESDENSTDTDTYPAPKAHNNNSRSISGKKKKSSSKGKNKKLLKSKKSKEHECPICNKIFRSGQALGGHKRSHFVGGSEENTLVIRPGAPPPVPCLIDLNLPAPVDE